MPDMQIREHIAKAIQFADDRPCPEGYAAANNFGDHEWLSDWGAFLADAVKQALDAAGYSIVPKYRCESCGRIFDSAQAKKAHRVSKHIPEYRRVSASERPIDRGDVACGICDHTFKNEMNANQHRKMAHGVETSTSSAVRGDAT